MSVSSDSYLGSATKDFSNDSDIEDSGSEDNASKGNTCLSNAGRYVSCAIIIFVFYTILGLVIALVSSHSNGNCPFDLDWNFLMSKLTQEKKQQRTLQKCM